MNDAVIQAVEMVPGPGDAPLSLGLDRGLVAVVGPDRQQLYRYLRTLAGLEPAAAGEVRLFGKAAAEWRPEWQVLRRLVAYVSAGSALLSTADGPRNLAMTVLYHRLLGADEVNARTEALLAEVPARVEPGWLPARLDPLARQCLLLARALMLEPAAMCVEHPLGGLDPNEADALHAYLLGPVRRRVPLLVVSRAAPAVAAVADQVLFVGPGQAHLFDSWSALKASPAASVQAFIEAARRPYRLLE